MFLTCLNAILAIFSVFRAIFAPRPPSGGDFEEVGRGIPPPTLREVGRGADPHFEIAKG